MEIPAKNAFWKKIKQGELSLPFTFWVVALFGNALFLGLVYLANQIDYSGDHWWSFLDYGVAKAYVLVMGYSILVMAAVWRSGDKYQGAFHWVVMARLGVLFSTAVVVFLSFVGLTHIREAQMTFAEKIAETNRHLPLMLDDGTRLDVATMDGKQVKYVYTLVNVEAEKMDVAAFAQMIRPMVLKSVCKADAIDQELRTGLEFDYYYRDQNGKFLASLSVTQADCAG